MIFRAGQYRYEFPRPLLLMGILNVTPDSFSDGGKFFDPSAALDQALRLIDEGADIIDVGGESTRPNAVSVETAEELRRVMPVLDRLCPGLKIPVSIDTQKVEVARAALDAGASIVNDIGAGRDDAAMWQLVASARAGYVAMHMQGTPQTMQANPRYQNSVQEVSAFFQDRLARMASAGLAPEQVVLDVGIGFGKTLEHNLELLAGLNSFTKLGRPLLLGISRKSFLGKLVGAEPLGRLPAALGCSCWAREQGVQILRTHDVRATREAIQVFETIQSVSKQCLGR